MPTTNYRPILRWQQNERIALRHLDKGSRGGTMPHIVLSPKHYGKVRKSRAKNPPSPPPSSKVFVKQVASNWGTDELYVDASKLVPIPGKKHPIEYIASTARKQGLALIPSTPLKVMAAYQSALKTVIGKDARGVALRISLQEMSKASSWISTWPFPASETDLIIDLGGSAPSVLALGIQAVAQAFTSLHLGKKWRSVTLAGGSIPPNLGGFPIGNTPTPIPRAELELWQGLSGSGLSYALDLGDYATIGPDASTEDIPGPVPINAKYTTKKDFLAFHGVKPTGPKKVPATAQLLGYAKAIHRYSPRDALAHSWGDNTIDAIATAGASPSTPANWVGYSINRHIEITRHQLP